MSLTGRVFPNFAILWKHIAELGPHWAVEAAKSAGEKAAETAANPAVLAATAVNPLVFPLAIVTGTVVEIVAERLRDRPEPEDLAKLYIEALLDSIEACTRDLPADHPDRPTIDLWRSGIKDLGKNNPTWAALLDESIPAADLSVDLADASTFWPVLRVQLDLMTFWLTAQRRPGASPLALNAPAPPPLSPQFDAHLAANLPRELLARFQPKVCSREHADAFNRLLLAHLAQLNAQLRPLDPLQTLAQLKKPSEANTVLKFLDPNYRAIPYIGRHADLQSLLQWLHGPAPISFRVITGRGGNGKTRFAYQFLEELENLHSHAWHAGIVKPERWKSSFANDSFRRWRLRKPTLIVIDYAEASADLLAREIVPELVSASLAESDPKLRFLLLARTADPRQGWYNSLLTAAGTSESDLFPDPPLTLADLNPPQRRALVDVVFAAVPRIETGAALHLPAEGTNPLIDARLADQAQADPLILAMAAVVAHTEQSLNAILHLHRTDLARSLAKHERRRLIQIAGNDKAAALVLHMAAYVNLAGAFSLTDLESRAESEIEATHLGNPSDIEAVARILAPTGIAHPILPDLIAEALIHDVLCDPLHHAQATIRRAAVGHVGTVTRTLVHVVQDFAPDPSRLNPADPQSVKRFRDDEACHQWALAQFTCLLDSHAEAISDDVYWEIVKELKLETVAMRRSSHDFYQKVGGLRDPAESYVGWHALNSLAIFRSFLGDRPGALALATQVVLYARQLVAADREKHLDDLAMSLNTQANRQSEMGQREAALQSIEEAVEHYRELAARNREAFLPNLAGALNNQANRQSEMGQREAALQSIEEAVKIRRELAARNREAFLPNLAGALNNQANRQSEMGQREAALQSIEEAVEHYRELAARNREAFLPNLAAALNNQANLQSEMGQREAALQSIEEAVEHYRELAARNREAFLPDLAMSLNNQANLQSEMGQREAALQSIEEAVKIRRELAARNREAFLPNLGAALNNQANRQSEMGQREAALQSIEEAVKIRRELAARNREAFLPNLGAALNNQANRQSEMGQREAALQSIEEAVKIRRELAARNREAFLPDLAMSLNNQANRQSEMGQREAALQSIEEAVKVRRELVARNRQAFTADLATSLGAFGSVLLAAGEPAEAAAKFAEGLRAITPMAVQLQQAYLPLALKLVRVYLSAAESANLTPDPETARCLVQIAELVKKPNPSSPESDSESATA